MLELSTGSRLHFGLMELSASQPHQYAGLGMMIEAPELRLQLRLAEASKSIPRDSSLELPVAVTGVAQDSELVRRIQLTATHALQLVLADQASSPPRNAHFSIEKVGLEICVIACPPLHSGLGVGTQLGAAVSRLVELMVEQLNRQGSGFDQQPTAIGLAPDKPTAPVKRLAHLSARGKRSAIGLHGFVYGGLIQDLGYQLCETKPELARPVATSSCALPESWRVVLLNAPHKGDVYGLKEDGLMATAARHPNPHLSDMMKLSHQVMHAATCGNFGEFTQTLDQYMLYAAELFAPVQCGRYRDAETIERVRLAQLAGLHAVGQSSWGPTVFGFAQDPLAAQHAVDRLSSAIDRQQLTITRPLHHGAKWMAKPDAQSMRDAR